MCQRTSTDLARRKVDEVPTSAGSSDVTESCDNSESEYDFFIGLSSNGSVSDLIQIKLIHTLDVKAIATELTPFLLSTTFHTARR
jgi:hypothetical protein